MTDAIASTKELTAAVCAAMATMEKMVKTGKNSFHKFSYLSVDGIKDYLRPILAENGLSIRMDEEHFETHELVEGSGKKGVHAHFRFALCLVHTSGAFEPPERCTIMLPYDGPTASGKARSYAVKEWLKAKFLASCGDKADIEEIREKDADGDESRKYSKTLPKAKGRAVYERLSGELRMLASKKAMDTWAHTNKSDLDTLPEDWQALLRQEYAEKAHEFKANGNGAPKKKPWATEMELDTLAALPAEIEPNPNLRKQLADSAFGAGYARKIADIEARLKLADGNLQAEIWDTEVEPLIEAQAIFPPDRIRLEALLSDA